MNFRIQTLEKTRLVYVMLYGSLPQVSSFLTQLLQATESWAEAKLVTSRNRDLFDELSGAVAQ